MTATSLSTTRVPDLSRDSLRDQVVVALTDIVLDGHLQPGDFLPSQKELTQSLGVSRVVLREATQWLQARGLVECIQGKGVVVNAPDPVHAAQTLKILLVRNDTALLDIWQVRWILEPEIAAIAAQNATSEHIQALKEAVKQMNDPNADSATVTEADARFHRVLVNATGNIVLALIINVVWNVIIESIEETMEAGPLDHTPILDAVCRNDPDAAREAMRSHMEDNRARTLRAAKRTK